MIDELFMSGFEKRRVPAGAGSIIIFERNIPYLGGIKDRGIFTAVDQEGGRVNRIKGGVTIIPPAGKIRKEDEAYGYGRIMAEELKPLGIGLNLAPVADVLTAHTSPIIGDRSFGSDSRKVSRLVSSMIRGMQESGLAACAKHFPGHGAAKRDSHKCLPRADISTREWEKVHLPPFKSAVKAGVSSVMVGHILCPAFDRRYPASLSHNVITGLLRGALGFEGVVITDDMCMGAVSMHYDPGEASILAINAGADIVMFCSDRPAQKKAKKAVSRAVSEGRISQKRVDESVKKILELKRVYGREG